MQGAWDEQQGAVTQFLPVGWKKLGTGQERQHSLDMFFFASSGSYHLASLSHWADDNWW